MLATEGTESGAEAWLEVGRGARACDLPALGGGEPPMPGHAEKLQRRAQEWAAGLSRGTHPVSQSWRAH